MNILKYKNALQPNIMNLLNTKGLQAFISNDLNLDLNAYLENNNLNSNDELQLRDKLNIVMNVIVNEKSKYKEELNSYLYNYIFNYELNNQIIYSFNELDKDEIQIVINNLKNYIQNVAKVDVKSSNFFDIDKVEDSFYILNKYEGKIEVLNRFFVNNYKNDKNSKSVFIGFEIDFANSMISFKYNEKRIVDSYKQEGQNIASNFSEMREFFLERLKKLTNDSLSLKIDNKEVDSNYYEKFLYDLFENDYKNKCLQFDNEIDSEIEDNLSEAVTNLDFHNIKAKTLIRNLKYYDIALGKTELDYTGFVFSFQFKDHNVTSSRTAAKKHKPIYTSDIYWNLVQVALDKEKITEVGILFDVEENSKKYSQEVLLTSKNGYFMIKYYQYELAKSSGTNLQYKFESRRVIDEHIKNKLTNFVSR
ncbi:hypothetical protein RCC94_15300 [Exiguobacterium acetylicum]|uniref:hypothetical protein n=1 Tax=Exiguobacterium acetylicum TaxID=41170 RepID=UPI0027DED6C1|nr:hypothetical protein [Exiguobacterium acetylicum]MDQ6468864.1 hypothetical protein [Exiguobacterium acetylicum]